MKPPVEPMLAKFADELPPAGGYVYEPKWDGFRAIVFRGEDEVYIQSRDSRPLDRCFPQLHDALLDRLPKNCVVDGEIVIATARGLDFDALQLRLHPLNGDWSPDRYPIDIANTWFADSYAIWGLKIGRTADRGLSWFIEGGGRWLPGAPWLARQAASICRSMRGRPSGANMRAMSSSEKPAARRSAPSPHRSEVSRQERQSAAPPLLCRALSPS